MLSNHSTIQKDSVIKYCYANDGSNVNEQLSKGIFKKSYRKGNSTKANSESYVLHVGLRTSKHLQAVRILRWNAELQKQKELSATIFSLVKSLFLHGY